MSIARKFSAIDKIILVSIFFPLVLIGRPALSQPVIEDTGYVYDHLRNWNYGLEFSQAFKCGSQVAFRSNTAQCQYRCNDERCIITCDEATHGGTHFKLTLGVCDAERAEIYGDNGLEIAVLKKDYEMAGNHWIISLLKSHAQFISPKASRIELNWARPHTIYQYSNGERKSLAASLISGQFFSGPVSQAMPFEIILLSGRSSGLAQLAYFRHSKDDVFMRQNEVRDVRP